MKYIKKFENINAENYKDDINVLYNTDKWFVFNPKSYDAILYWCNDTEWSFLNKKRYDFNKYNINSKINKIFILIDKEDNKKYYFDFYSSSFYDEEEDNITLRDFFEDNSELFPIIGEVVNCNNVVKVNDEYWISISDNNWFADYFKLDSRIRDDYVKCILEGDSYEIFSYSSSDFNLDENMKLDEEALDYIKMYFRLEKDQNEYDTEYDYNVEDIKDYDDVVDLINDWDFDDLEKLLKRSICGGHERADADKAYDDVIDHAYEFFGLVDKTAQWVGNNLHIKFKSNSDAYLAKFIIENYDDSYKDYVIEFSPPYYGYSGDDKAINEYFNEDIFERFDDYVTNDRLDKYYDIFKELKKENPNIKEEEILPEIKFRLETKKYNL